MPTWTPGVRLLILANGAIFLGMFLIFLMPGGESFTAALQRWFGIAPGTWREIQNANRPDAMSVAGVARDLAAALGVPFSFPEWNVERSGEDASAQATIEILDPDLCGRFAARVLHNVSVAESPRWIQNRLIALGQRPINSVVDISNYVMFELGQPNHVFDLDTIPDGHLKVRRATDGETMVTLDGAERETGSGAIRRV